MAGRVTYQKGPFRTIYKPGSVRLIHNRLLNVLETYKDMDIILEDGIYKVYVIEEDRLLTVTCQTYNRLRTHETITLGHARGYVDTLRAKNALYSNFLMLN
mgnify:CR=1 FL=1